MLYHTATKATPMHDNDLPFAGLTVLDLSQGVAGPYAGMLLARNGANVIKLEPPGAGDWARNSARPGMARRPTPSLSTGANAASR